MRTGGGAAPRRRLRRPTVFRSRGGLTAVRVQPGVELGCLILQNDPVQETVLQGHADREDAQAERLAPRGRLSLALLHPQFASVLPIGLRDI